MSRTTRAHARRSEGAHASNAQVAENGALYSSRTLGEAADARYFRFVGKSSPRESPWTLPREAGGVATAAKNAVLKEVDRVSSAL
jgi:hypothetical protein